jgi:hypothetical protein
MVVVAHFADELTVAWRGVDCVDDTLGLDTLGLDTLGLDTLGLDTLGLDTLGLDTLGLDTLGPRYRIVPYPRP